jgi:hypothetical protein
MTHNTEHYVYLSVVNSEPRKTEVCSNYYVMLQSIAPLQLLFDSFVLNRVSRNNTDLFKFRYASVIAPLFDNTNLKPRTTYRELWLHISQQHCT